MILKIYFFIVASPTCADTCSTTEGWTDGESEDDHDSGKESTPTTSGPGTPTTATTAGSVCKMMVDPKPAAPEVDPSMLEFEWLRMIYSSPPLHDEYPKLVRASITEHYETTEDVEMKESRDAFEKDVMPYYFSAISSNGCDPIFEVPSPPSSPPIPPSGSAEYDLGGYSTRIEKEFADVFARRGF